MTVHPEEPRLAEAAQKVVEALKRHGPTAIYLFGSAVTGPLHPGSDLDLAVLFPPHKRLTTREKGTLAADAEDAAGIAVDLVFLAEARLPVQFEVVRNGRVLWEQSPDARTDFEEAVLRQYMDFEPLLRRSYQEMLQDVLGKEEPPCRTTNQPTTKPSSGSAQP